MAVYKINEKLKSKKKVDESYDDGKVSINQLREAISSLEELVTEMEINDITSVQASPNTYGLGSFFLCTSSGYINLNDVYSYVSYDEDESLKKESLAESADPKNYKVFTMAMDVAVPADKSLRELGVGSTDPRNPLYNALSDALESLGLEMAGDYIDSTGEVTQVYKDNEYEFNF